jgi:hypothetical protein
VIDTGDILEQSPQLWDIGDIATSEKDSGIKAFRIASRQVIDHPYFVPGMHQVIGKSRTNETCTTGYQDAHVTKLQQIDG